MTKKSEMTIDILLATYNGDKYLDAQLKSVLDQTYKHWKLIVRDDGSKDKTLKILQHYANKFPDKIKIILDNDNNIGACQNFAKLLNHSNSEYIMFCDQDDIWLPDKIKITLDKMIEVEKKIPDKPILIHTDLNIVDENLNHLSNSMWKYQNLDLSFEKNIYKIAIHNVVTGCTVMINKAAKNCSCPIPQKALMHDWWIAINVCKYGIIDHVPQSTILYRQHSDNKYGAIRKNLNYYLKRITNTISFSKDDYIFLNMIKVLNFKLNKKLILINTFSIILTNLFNSIVAYYKNITNKKGY